MPTTPPQTNIKWFSLRDFTPGCVDQTRFAAIAAGGKNYFNPQTAQAAHPAYTYGCVALPGGGLAPLPAITRLNIAPPTPSDYGSGLLYVSGIKTFGPSQYQHNGITDALEVVFGYENNLTPNGESYAWYEIATNVDNSYHYISTNAYNSGPNFLSGYVSGAYLVTSFLAKESYGVGSSAPVLVMGHRYLSATDGTAPIPRAYPDPSDLTHYTSWQMNGGQAVEASWIANHQGRIVMGESGRYQRGTAILANGLITSEYVFFTDPVGSDQVPNAQTPSLWVPEEPFGYGCVSGVDAAELLAIKLRKGAVMISGSLNTPTVTRLPGVQDTGGIYVIGDSMPLGFVYLSYNAGAWIWGGGNSSSKISDQLRDDFFLIPTSPFFNDDPATPQQFGVCAQVEDWGDWVLVSNSWLYDTNIKSWWRLTQQDIGDDLQWYSGASYGDLMFAAFPSYQVGSNQYPIALLNKEVLQSSYVWQGYPLQDTVDREVQITEITCEWIPVDGQSITISLAGNHDGQTIGTDVIFPFNETVTTAFYHPVRETQRVDFAASSVSVQISASGTTQAPIVTAVHLGYVDGRPTNAM